MGNIYTKCGKLLFVYGKIYEINVNKRVCHIESWHVLLINIAIYFVTYLFFYQVIYNIVYMWYNISLYLNIDTMYIENIPPNFSFVL